MIIIIIIIIIIVIIVTISISSIIQVTVSILACLDNIEAMFALNVQCSDRCSVVPLKRSQLPVEALAARLATSILLR